MRGIRSHATVPPICSEQFACQEKGKICSMSGFPCKMLTTWNDLFGPVNETRGAKERIAPSRKSDPVYPPVISPLVLQVTLSPEIPTAMHIFGATVRPELQSSNASPSEF